MGWKRLIALVPVVAACSAASSGIYLVFRYQPGGTNQLTDAVVFAHDIATWGLGAAAVGLTVLVVQCRPRAVGRWVGAVALVGAGVVASYVSGTRLPWTQVALTEVTEGTKIAGYPRLAGDDVEFVLRPDDGVTSAGTMLGWLVGHVVVGGLVLVGLATLANLARRSANVAP